MIACLACGSWGDGTADSAGARPPGEASRQLSIEIDRARPKLARREWSTTQGGAAATAVGFFTGDTLRLIQERLALGDHGRSANRYYFALGSLRYYESEEERVKTDSTHSATRHKERTALAFNRAGALEEASYLVDGQIAPFDSVRLREVRERAKVLATQAATAPAAASKVRR